MQVMQLAKEFYKKYIYMKEDSMPEESIKNVPHFIIGDKVRNRDGVEGVVIATGGDEVEVIQKDDDDIEEARTYNAEDLYCLSVDKDYMFSYQPYLTKTCDHNMDEFKLRTGSIYLSAVRNKVKAKDAFKPTHGCYMDTSWMKERFLTSATVNLPTLNLLKDKDNLEQQVLHIRWPDRDIIPVNDLHTAVVFCHGTVADNSKVLEIGCHGAHGRTGTLLAAIIVYQGATAEEAIDQVRSEHCSHAIETKSQEMLIKEYRNYIEDKNIYLEYRGEKNA